MDGGSVDDSQVFDQVSARLSLEAPERLDRREKSRTSSLSQPLVIAVGALVLGERPLHMLAHQR